MLRSYFKTTWRRMRANKTYAVLNVGGLAVGLASFIVIALYVHDELSYDTFHEHRDRVYRVVSDATWPESPMTRVAITSRPVADALRDFNEVERVARLVPFTPTIAHGRHIYRDFRVFYAEPEFFDIFTFPLIEGDPDTALDEPYAMVITESAARTMFGSEPALGTEVTFNESFPVRVTGITEDPPSSSHLHFDVLVSYATHEIMRPAPDEPQWLEMQTYTYLLLDREARIEEIEPAVRDLARTHYGETLAEYGVALTLGVQPLTSIYLHSRRDREIGAVGDSRFMVAFGFIALFVLLISCINYTNLATARSMRRAREVGVRKSLGADRSMLMKQFLATSVLTTAAAMIVALLLVNRALPLLNYLTGKELLFSTLLTPPFAGLLLVLTMSAGLVAGAYPAIVLSGFLPAPILKGRFSQRNGRFDVQKALVTFQFAVSVTLLVGTLVIVQQMNYVRNHDLGFNPNQLITIDARVVHPRVFHETFDVVKEDLLQRAAINGVTVSSSSPGKELPLLLTMAEGLNPGESRRSHVVSVDFDYVDTYDLNVIAGRNMSIDYPSDALEAALLNESAVSQFGWGDPEEAIGKWVQFGSERREVVGVVADYHHLSLRREVEPMKMLYLSDRFNTFTLRVAGADLTNTIREIRSVWREHYPGHPLNYTFIDEQFNQQYQADVRLASLVGVFALLTVGLACVGLFGLSAYNAQQRRREIGIRKAMGASVASILGLLTKDFLKLVLLGFGIGAPVAYIAMNRWLDGFAYHMTIGAETIVLAGVALLFIALLTVSYQAIKAAWTNPTEAIRTE